MLATRKDTSASECVTFDDRAERLEKLTRSAERLQDHPLVQVLKATALQRQRVRTALNLFLWECLNVAFPDKDFTLSDDMLRDYPQEVTTLPNITPNGLVLPKRENMLSFNLLQKEAIAAFDALGISDEIARVQYPVNIRMQSGTPNPAVDSRPRASVKAHSDIWAGDPASGILVFLSVLGDPKNSGINFMLPKEFPLSYVRTLEDYLEGKHLAEGAEMLGSFDERGWFLADPYTLHQTTKNGSGWRISLDFRFIPRTRVQSDIDEDATRQPFFISVEEWRKLGVSRFIATQDGMLEFAIDRKKDPYTVGYPVKIYTVDMEQ